MYRATDSQSPDCISVRRASTALLCPPAREEKERNYSLPSSLLSAELYRMRMFSVSRGKVVSHGESIQSRRGSQSSRYSGDSSVPTRPHSRSSNPCLVQEVRTDLVKVLMLGASEVGKSSLCVQFVTSEHVNTYHSVGEAKHYITEHHITRLSCNTLSISDDSVCKEVHMAVNKEEARIVFIDHKHGEISLDSQLALYSPDAFLVVMAVDDRSTLCQAELLLSHLSSRDLLHTKPVILVANKTDLVRNRVIKQSGQYLALSFSLALSLSSLLRLKYFCRTILRSTDHYKL